MSTENYPAQTRTAKPGTKRPHGRTRTERPADTFTQIIPAAPGWTAVARQRMRDGAVMTLRTEIAAWGLTSAGVVMPLVPACDGTLASARDSLETDDVATYSPIEGWEHEVTEGEAPGADDWQPVVAGGDFVVWRRLPR